MKKLLILLTVSLMVFGLAACSTPKAKTFELALITDIGEIDDKSFNQGAWEGLKKYADANKKTYAYYKPTDPTTDAYISAIDLAVKAGAKVIVTPGWMFELPVYKAQDTYPNVKFILLDGSPNNGDFSNNMANFKAKINTNVYSIFYREEQSGFLAGYAAVKDGYTKLAFMGGKIFPAVIRFGYGFAQGAEYAAKELGKTEITLKYHYTGDFADTPENKAKAASWYQAGVEVIFAAGGKIGNSVMSAANDVSKKVIGVDVDQSAESPTVITSAMKELGNSVFSALDMNYKNTFPGGNSDHLGADVNGIGLPQDFSRFKTFKKADYDAIFEKLVANTITVKNDVDGGDEAGVPDATKLGLTAVTISFEK